MRENTIETHLQFLYKNINNNIEGSHNKFKNDERIVIKFLWYFV